MIFLTIGTLFGFDRLVRAVDEAIRDGALQESVFAQIGPGEYRPRHMEALEVLDKETFEARMAAATALISHAGMGSISLALKLRKPMLVLPRLHKYGEHVNDHQLHTARKFESLGCVLAAYDTPDLIFQYPKLNGFVPRIRVANREGVIRRLEAFLSETSVR